MACFSVRNTRLESSRGRRTRHEALLRSIPNLRAFALSLSGDRDHADDLVQDTLLAAIRAADRFQAGTILLAWLFTILRNRFFSEHRKQKRREIQDPNGT